MPRLVLFAVTFSFLLSAQSPIRRTIDVTIQEVGSLQWKKVSAEEEELWFQAESGAFYRVDSESTIKGLKVGTKVQVTGQKGANEFLKISAWTTPPQKTVSAPVTRPAPAPTPAPTPRVSSYSVPSYSPPVAARSSRPPFRVTTPSYPAREPLSGPHSRPQTGYASPGAYGMGDGYASPAAYGME